MLGSKRPVPAGGFDVTHSKASNDARKSIFESTLSKLRAGARHSLNSACAPGSKDSMDLDKQNTSKQPRCNSCSHEGGCNKCSHCTKNLCLSCSRTCGGCEDVFCGLCSIQNFEERNDRTFCLDCNARELQTRPRHRSRSSL